MTSTAFLSPPPAADLVSDPGRLGEIAWAMVARAGGTEAVRGG